MFLECTTNSHPLTIPGLSCLLLIGCANYFFPCWCRAVCCAVCGHLLFVVAIPVWRQKKRLTVTEYARSPTFSHHRATWWRLREHCTARCRSRSSAAKVPSRPTNESLLPNHSRSVTKLLSCLVFFFFPFCARAVSVRMRIACSYHLCSGRCVV